jgi:peptide/nickel transport system substrate-binding protein
VIEKAENPDPATYLWTLRQGIKFQDGTDLNAEAVKFNLNRHIQDPKSVRNQDVKTITAIDTPDARTVKLTLSAPYAPFPNKVAGVGAGALLSPAAVAKLGDNLQRDLTGAGAGAYKFKEWQRDTQVTVERNESYWKKDADGSALPYLDSFTFKIFPDENVRLTNVKTGDADILQANPPPKDVADLKTNGDLTVLSTPDVGWQFLTLNTAKEPFNNPAIRRAFSYAIDRDQIVKTVLFNATGKVQDTPVPDTIPWAYDKDAAAHPYLKRDIAKAKSELAAGGKPNGFKFTMQISNASPVIQQTAELIKDQIKEIGLDLQIQPIEFATVVSNANAGDYESSYIGWSGGTDPDDHLYSLFYTKAGFNLSKYTNPEMDKLLDSGRTTLDQAKRGDIYKQAQKILMQDQPFIILSQNVRIFVARKKIQSMPTTFNGYWGTRDYDRMWKQK